MQVRNIIITPVRYASPDSRSFHYAGFICNSDFRKFSVEKEKKLVSKYESKKHRS